VTKSSSKIDSQTSCIHVYTGIVYISSVHNYIITYVTQLALYRFIYITISLTSQPLPLQYIYIYIYIYYIPFYISQFSIRLLWKYK